MPAMIDKINYYLRTFGFGGLACAIRAKIARCPVMFECRRADCRHPFRLRIPSTDLPTYEQIFVRRQYDFVARREPRVIVDAGANIGLASIWFANKFPDATIFALEPERSNFELLELNAAAYPNIVPVRAALWHRNEEISLVDPGLGHWGFMTEARADGVRGKLRHAVAAMTVDALMAKFGLDRVDILKIDIEGAEKEVFSETAAWIGAVDAIIIELHERLKSGCNRSFYAGAHGFDEEWMQGENVYLTRTGCLVRPGA